MLMNATKLYDPKYFDFDTFGDFLILGPYDLSYIIGYCKCHR